MYDSDAQVSVYRNANERVRALAHHAGNPRRPVRLDFVCECGAPDCDAIVDLLTDDFDEIVVDGGYVLGRGHALARLAAPKHAV